MSDWQNVALGEILDVHNGFAFKSKDFLEQGVPVIKIKNVKPNTILLDTLSYVSEELASQKSRYLIKPDDILITMSGNRFDGSPETWVGKVALFKIKGTYLLNQRVSCLRVDRKLALPEFIAYLLSSWHYQVYFINHANSSGGQANISPTIVQEVEIDLPSLEEQEGITAVLSSLDDKIDLLHRQNKTLEALAQTLFRHWFIDGAEDDWEERPLDEIAVYLNGLACQKYPPENESDRLPVLKIKELRNGISDQSDWATNTVSEEYIVE
ncbi:MAG: restriction endonuclease subunit S, partial [Anaerolineae bacterium]|nr:restriction endonuclease subunit S [Anaerolineae bacterium]